ncbi:MAG: sodium:calcium antiporter [Pirellulaceae bacterium]
MEQLPLWINIGVFAVAAAVVWIAGTSLAIAAEEISDRRRMGKAIMGLLVLATATELPEIVTTLVAAASDNAELLLNNMFGGIALQTAILAIADATAIHVAITHYPRKTTPILEGTLLILILGVLNAIILIGDIPLAGHMGVASVVMAGLYFWAVVLLRRTDRKTGWRPVEIPPIPEGARAGMFRLSVSALSDRSLYLRFGIASLAILVFGGALVFAAEGIAIQTGLGNSFVGATLLAGSTSLPELSTTIMAVRLHSFTMAISNIFGSNLIMTLLILPADVLYVRGPLLLEADPSAVYALICGIIVTAIYVIGLVVRGRQRILGMGYDSFAVILVYLASVAILFGLK